MLWDSLITCLDSFLEDGRPAPSSIWVGCRFTSTSGLPLEYGST